MCSEIAYPDLMNRTILVVEAPNIGVPLISILASDAGMRGILIPELFFSNDPNLLLDLKQANDAEFAAVHVPGVGASYIADIRVEQVTKLPKNKTVIMRGFTVNTESEAMFETIASVGYAIIRKADSKSLLELLSSMA